jgi:hypothetical protein
MFYLVPFYLLQSPPFNRHRLHVAGHPVWLLRVIEKSWLCQKSSHAAAATATTLLFYLSSAVAKFTTEHILLLLLLPRDNLDSRHVFLWLFAPIPIQDFFCFSTLFILTSITFASLFVIRLFPSKAVLKNSRNTNVMGPVRSKLVIIDFLTIPAISTSDRLQKGTDAMPVLPGISGI